MLVDPLLCMFFLLSFALSFPFLSFFLFVTKKTEKLVLMQKQMIPTSKRCAEHPFAGQNKQHIFLFWFISMKTDSLGLATNPLEAMNSRIPFASFCRSINLHLPPWQLELVSSAKLNNFDWLTHSVLDNTFFLVSTYILPLKPWPNFRGIGMDAIPKLFNSRWLQVFFWVF